MAGIRSTVGTQLVLQVFLVDPTSETFGYDLMKATRLSSGTIYPILERLEANGWVSSKWEGIDPEAEGRPQRRLYRLTGVGQTSARALLDEHERRMRYAARPALGETL